MSSFVRVTHTNSVCFHHLEEKNKMIEVEREREKRTRDNDDDDNDNDTASSGDNLFCYIMIINGFLIDDLDGFQ